MSVEPQGMDWNALVKDTSGTEVVEHQGWALGDFRVPRAGRYSVHCSHLNTLYVERRVPTPSASASVSASAFGGGTGL